MRRRLGAPVEAPAWPDDVRLKAFTQWRAADAHALMELAYAVGGGSVPAFAQWWGHLSQDGEYDPALCFLVCDADQETIAFAQCWTSAFVKDFVIHPHHRRRGIGQALLLHIFGIFQARGAQAVDLKVLVDNPSGAIPFYESQGMDCIQD
jgi:ribosomal protein S18 acetylase RimI-like enzyme